MGVIQNNIGNFGRKFKPSTKDIRERRVPLQAAHADAQLCKKAPHSVAIIGDARGSNRTVKENKGRIVETHFQQNCCFRACRRLLMSNPEVLTFGWGRRWGAFDGTVACTNDTTLMHAVCWAILTISKVQSMALDAQSHHGT